MSFVTTSPAIRRQRLRTSRTFAASLAALCLAAGLGGCAEMKAKDYTAVIQLTAETYSAVQTGRQARAAANLSNAQADLVRTQIDAARKAIDLSSSGAQIGAGMQTQAMQIDQTSRIRWRPNTPAQPTKAANLATRNLQHSSDLR